MSDQLMGYLSEAHFEGCFYEFIAHGHFEGCFYEFIAHGHFEGCFHDGHAAKIYIHALIACLYSWSLFLMRTRDCLSVIDSVVRDFMYKLMYSVREYSSRGIGGG
jgi:hypothetical protein